MTPAGLVTNADNIAELREKEPIFVCYDEEQAVYSGVLVRDRSNPDAGKDILQKLIVASEPSASISAVNSGC